MKYEEKHVRFLSCNSLSIKVKHYKKCWKHKSLL